MPSRPGERGESRSPRLVGRDAMVACAGVAWTEGGCGSIPWRMRPANTVWAIGSKCIPMRTAPHGCFVNKVPALRAHQRRDAASPNKPSRAERRRKAASVSARVLLFSTTLHTGPRARLIAQRSARPLGAKGLKFARMGQAQKHTEDRRTLKPDKLGAMTCVCPAVLGE